MPTGEPFPKKESNESQAVRRFLFECIAGSTGDDQQRWKKLWSRIVRASAGEVIRVAFTFDRSGAFHRRHMAMEQAVFNAQERFSDFEQFRNWIKVGAGWVDWCAGAKGGVVPIPKSVSYSKADQVQFEEFHKKVLSFLWGEYAHRFLWRHLSENKSYEMMASVLQEFDQ